MGGAAFATLVTPRMPPAVYQAALDRCHKQLRTLFKVVVTPLEGPEKADHGDIDVFVCRPVEQQELVPSATAATNGATATQGIWDKIQDALGAEASKFNPKESSAHFAIPYPTDPIVVPEAGAACPEQPESPSDGRFIQVDVRIFETEKSLQWEAFKHSHGDLWNILGSIVRPWGLTADDKAMWLRVPEIERFDKKRARVFLTDEPAQVLSFLGMDVARWSEPFATCNELFEYAASTWMFFLNPPNSDDWPGAYRFEEPSETSESSDRPFKSNDRRRMKTRSLFRDWVEGFLPISRAAQRYPPQPPVEGRKCATMAELRCFAEEKLFLQFPGAEPSYTSKRAEFLQEQDRLNIKNVVIKGSVDKEECVRKAEELHAAPHEYYSVVVTAMKNVVLEGSDSYGGILPDPALRDADGSWDMDAVKDFVEKRWRDVAPHAWEKNREVVREKMRLKELKRKADEDPVTETVVQLDVPS